MGHVLEEAHSLLDTPAQGMIDIPILDHLGQPSAAVRRLLHRQEQGQKLRLLPAAGEFRQSLRKRQVLRLAVRR